MSDTYTHTKPHYFRMCLQECCYCPSKEIEIVIFSDSHVIQTCNEHMPLAIRDIKAAYYQSGVILSDDVLNDELFKLIPKEFQGVRFDKYRFLIQDESGWNIPIVKIDGSTSSGGTMAISVSELIHLLPSDQKNTPLLVNFLEKLNKGFYYDEFIANEAAKVEKLEFKKPDVLPNVKLVQLADGRIARMYVP